MLKTLRRIGPMPRQGAHTLTERSHWSRKSKVFGLVVGIVLAGGIAGAATNWVIGLASGSSGEGQSANIQNLMITASTQSATNLLYPGGSGDAVMTITNPNPFPVTITAVQLPANTAPFAGGFTNAALTTAQSGCTTSTSDVIWNFSTASSGSNHNLNSPLTVAANGTLVATMTNDVSMTSGTPLQCANTFFSMPSLTGVTATGGAATATTSPTTDFWNS